MEGPIAFRADGTPLQLGMTRDAKTGLSSLQLWDAAKQSAKVITLPDGAGQIVAHAISPEGTYVGAVVEVAKGERTILVWETATGRSLPKIKFQAVGLSFSPDASLVVAWDDGGKIGLWSLPETVPVAMLQSGDTRIRCTAFGRARGLSTPKTAIERWLLATGDAGGTMTIWNLKKQVPRNFCRGSQYDIYAVAFSPDGTTMASAGRTQAKLWDVATGRLLLSLIYRNTMTALAFSPDGTRLAVGSKTAHRTSRGRRCLPSGGRTWHSDLPRTAGTGPKDDLLSRRPAHRGTLTGLAGCPLGSGLRQASNHPGCAPGVVRRQLRPGFQSRRPALRLLGRTSGEALGPRHRQGVGCLDSSRKAWWIRSPFPGRISSFSYAWRPKTRRLLRTIDTRPKEFPRVLRLRSLLRERPTGPLQVITDFNWNVHHAAATPDGKYFVVEGLGGPEGNTRSVNAYDAVRRGETLDSSFKEKPRVRIGDQVRP